MPRPGPRRPLVAFKLDQEAIERVDARALAEGMTIRGGEPNRSELIRLAVEYALAEMPAGWRPEES
jgi:hypothetical protein